MGQMAKLAVVGRLSGAGLEKLAKQRQPGSSGGCSQQPARAGAMVVEMVVVVAAGPGKNKNSWLAAGAAAADLDGPGG